MVDLHPNIIPKYAIHWMAIGAALGLEQHHFDNISYDNASMTERVVACCTAMFRKWLKVSPSPTWGKLDDAIKITRSSVKPILPCCRSGDRGNIRCITYKQLSYTLLQVVRYSLLT